jgi:hypothetical protein
MTIANTSLPETEQHILLVDGRFIEQRTIRRDIGAQADVVTRYMESMAANQDSQIVPLLGLEENNSSTTTPNLVNGDFENYTEKVHFACVTPRHPFTGTSNSEYYSIQRMYFMPFRGNFIRIGKNEKAELNFLDHQPEVRQDFMQRASALRDDQFVLIPRGSSSSESSIYNTRLYMGPLTYMVVRHTANNHGDITPENLWILTQTAHKWYVYNIPNLGTSGAVCTGTTDGFHIPCSTLMHSHLQAYGILHENPFNFDLFDSQNMINCVIDEETKSTPQAGHPFFNIWSARKRHNVMTYPLDESARIIKHLNKWVPYIRFSNHPTWEESYRG